MIEIKDLLERFSTLILSEENKKEAVRCAVAETLQTEIRPEDIKIKGNVIYLNLKPIYKNEVFLKREDILKKMQGQLFGKNPPTEIR